MFLSFSKYFISHASQPGYEVVSSSKKQSKKLKKGEYRLPQLPWPERDFLRLAHVDKSHEGTWECTVKQEALNLTWRTAWIDVKIIAAPSYFSHLLEDDATRWLFKWTGSETGVQILVAVIILLVLGACFLVYHSVIKLYTSRKMPMS